MVKTISIGAQSFEFIREHDCFFVDKTGLIKEWWENADAVTLITRTRRCKVFKSFKIEGAKELKWGLLEFKTIVC